MFCVQVPGNIRRAEHFVAFLRRFVLYLKEKLGVNEVTTENPTTFLAQLQERLAIEGTLETTFHLSQLWCLYHVAKTLLLSSTCNVHLVGTYSSRGVLILLLSCTS